MLKDYILRIKYELEKAGLPEKIVTEVHELLLNKPKPPTEKLVEVTIDAIKCHICGSLYARFSLGRKHVYATCQKCERRDEVGMVF